MKQILIIEDDKDIRDSITEVLEGEGYSIANVANGKEGLDYLLSDDKPRPDLILLDLMMPVMSGMEFRTRQLAMPQLADIPVVVMSADNRAVQKAEEMRSAICIRKPLEIDDLLSALSKLLS